MSLMGYACCVRRARFLQSWVAHSIERFVASPLKMLRYQKIVSYNVQIAIDAKLVRNNNNQSWREFLTENISKILTKIV